MKFLSIINYIKSLLPTIKKDRIIEDLSLLKTSVASSIDKLNKANELLSTIKNKSEEYTYFEKIFTRIVKKKMLVTISDVIKKIPSNIEILEDFYNKEIKDDIYSDSITIKKANIIKLISGIKFVSDYTLELFNYILSKEYDKQTGTVSDSYSPGEIKELKNNFSEYCSFIVVLMKADSHLKDILDKIPDLVITDENRAMVESTLGEYKTNPFGFAMESFKSYSPIYHISLIVAEYQANRIKYKMELIKTLELRILALQQLIDTGKSDAAIEKELDYIKNRTDRLNNDVRKALEK